MRLVFCDDFYPERSSFRILEGDWLRARYGADHLKVTDAETLPADKYDLALTVGLIQTLNRLAAFEHARLPFVFENYPGFGFNLRTRDAEIALRRIVASPYFRGMMCNMRVGFEYARDRIAVPERLLHFCYGGFVDQRVFVDREPVETPTVYFCAESYDDGVGLAKGFDIFHGLAGLFPAQRFVAFGTWTPPWSARPNLELRGTVDHDVLRATYRPGDVFVSPNRSVDGVWDGFPTHAAVEAGGAGACLLLSDPLDNNVALREGEDFVLVDESTIRSALATVLADRERRLRIGANGKRRLREIYAIERQFAARETMIEEAMR